MEDISADPVPQQRRDRHALRREREAWALEVVKRIGRPPEPRPVSPPRPRPVRPPIERPKEPEVGEVYFLYACNRIKIGTSKNHIHRVLNEITPYCPAPLFFLGTIPGGYPTERGLHGRFAASWAHGEWFELDPDLREFLDGTVGAQKLGAAETQYREWLEEQLQIQKEKGQ